MASVKGMGMREYCDTMYNELSGMKDRLLEFANEIEHFEGNQREVLRAHVQHFQDIARTIEWKLEILTKVCPFDWSGYKGVEKTAAVRLQEGSAEKETISGGYVGG